MKLTISLMMDPHEVYKDIARIPEDYRIDVNGRRIKEGAICEVTIGDMSTLLSLRGSTTDSRPNIQIDEKTRNALHLAIGREADFDFRQVGWLGQYLWAWRASDPAYRLGARFGLLSLILSFVGVVLAILGLTIALCSN